MWEQGRLAGDSDPDGPGEIIGFIQDVTDSREKPDRLERNARRALALEPALPVLVMSGYAADSPGQTSELPPDAAFLPKPFTPARLVDRVHETLAG